MNPTGMALQSRYRAFPLVSSDSMKEQQLVCQNGSSESERQSRWDSPTFCSRAVEGTSRNFQETI